jgi:hypothetical protein
MSDYLKKKFEYLWSFLPETKRESRIKEEVIRLFSYIHKYHELSTCEHCGNKYCITDAEIHDCSLPNEFCCESCLTDALGDGWKPEKNDEYDYE